MGYFQKSLGDILLVVYTCLYGDWPGLLLNQVLVLGGTGLGWNRWQHAIRATTGVVSLTFLFELSYLERSKTLPDIF